MKTSDYIAQRVKKETDTVFGVTGGYVVNLVDSFKKAGISVIPFHHEQCASIAADAYARFKPLGVCFSTSGPGVTNLLTGTCCSYFDSVPVLTFGGQVPSKFLNKRDRQTGFQETDGVKIFEPVTKLSTRFYHSNTLEEVIEVAKTPRKGPVFLEIADDVQRMEVDNYNSQTRVRQLSSAPRIDILKFKKPLVIVGAGAREMPVDFKIPFLCTWGIKDRFYHHPYYKGDFGTTGSQKNNQLLKEADVIIFLGTKFDTHHYPNWNEFAPDAYKIAIGLEFPHTVDEKYNYSLDFEYIFEGPDWCGRSEENQSTGEAYLWIDELSEQAREDDIIIPDMGQTGCIAFQRWSIKEGQRLFNGMNHSPMGYSIPGAIGASLATGRRVIVIIGEGSLMMNLQELQTISDLDLPINIFVVNNGGYGMIRQTQADWSKYLDQGVACNFKSPDIKKLANLFDLEYTSTLKYSPTIYEYKFTTTQILPKWKFGDKL